MNALGSAAAMAPFDVLAVIFLELDLADLYKCQRVCKSWRQAAQDDLVLRALCWRKGHAEGQRDLGILKQPYRPPSAKRGISDGHCYSLARVQGCDDPETWEEVLKRDRLLRRIKAPPRQEGAHLTPSDFGLHDVVKCYSNHQDELQSHIWRVKVDPIDNVMITTGSRGGLTVLDLGNGQELWRDDSVKAFADLDSGEGWVVHERNDDGQGSHEVRKFERLVNGVEKPRRGHLTSMGTIHCPPEPRAFFLAWPQLAVAFDEAVLIYDVRELRVSEIVSMVDPDVSQPKPVSYVSMDKDFIFVLRGYRVPIHSNDGYDYGREDGGLYVYRRKDGRLLFDPKVNELECESAWEMQELGLDRLCFKGQPLSGCSNLGIATELVRSRQAEYSAYIWSPWCQVVQPDARTGSLVLSGPGRIMVIPDYAEAFVERGPCHLPITSIGVGEGDDMRGRCTVQLGVADGVAAFVSAVHNLPAWIDLQSLIDASSRSRSNVPRASTLCLGPSILCDTTAVIFQKSSAIHLNSTRLVVVADFLQEDASQQPPKYKAYFMAVVMDFGAVLRAKLSLPSEPFDKKPSSVSVGFPRRTRAEDKERASWRENREAWPLAKVVLPSTAVKWWHHWASRYLAPQRSSERKRTSRSGEDVKTPREARPDCDWRGRVPPCTTPGDTLLPDNEPTDEAMAKYVGSQLADAECWDWTDSDAEQDSGSDGDSDDAEEAMLEEGERADEATNRRQPRLDQDQEEGSGQQ